MAMELIQNIWSRYGFRGNPFDTAALELEIDRLVNELGVYPADLSGFFLAEGGKLTPAKKDGG